MMLYASMICSQVWQSEFRAKLVYDFQKAGFEEAHKSDWAKVIDDFGAANRIDSSEVRAWRFDFPTYGWSLFHLAPKKENAFDLVHDSVIAYAFAQEGKKDEADAAYAKLQKQYPAKDRKYFESVAKELVGSPNL